MTLARASFRAHAGNRLPFGVLREAHFICAKLWSGLVVPVLLRTRPGSGPRPRYKVRHEDPDGSSLPPKLGLPVVHAVSHLGKRGMRPVRLYRWRRQGSPHGNFGDEITIPILDRIFGLEALPVGFKDAELLGAGSTLEFYLWKIGRPPVWKRFLWPSDLHVWGTGTLFDQHEIRWPQRLHFHALRGSLTAQRVGVNDIALGDPGILSGRLIRRPKKVSAVAAVPHFLDKGRLSDLPRHWRVVDPEQPVDDVLAQIASAELVLSSSLHGLIAADSFGIPCVWISFLGGQPDSPTHKFMDHASTRGRDFNAPITWAEAVLMPTDTLASKATTIGRDIATWQEELIAAFPMKGVRWC